MFRQIITCDAYHPNPAGAGLIRCRKHARSAVTIQAGHEIEMLHRCGGCMDELKKRAASERATLEIVYICEFSEEFGEVRNEKNG